MFSFFSKKNVITASNELLLKTDIHSHILPGIDDGSADISTSLQLIKEMYDLGIRKMIGTPHINEDTYRNTPKIINAALEKLKIACKEAQIDVELGAAAEYMLDNSFFSLLQKESPLLTIYNNVILTEQSYVVQMNNLPEMAFEILTTGYKPIMAHPERYSYYHDNYEEYIRLKDMGFLLQVNLLSLTGYYGKHVFKAAKFLFDKKLVDFVGTDVHHEKHISILKENISLINEYISQGTYNDFNFQKS